MFPIVTLCPIVRVVRLDVTGVLLGALTPYALELVRQATTARYQSTCSSSHCLLFLPEHQTTHIHNVLILILFFSFFFHSNNVRPTGGASGVSGPFQILAGYFGGEGASTSQGSSECPAGYYCPLGSADTVCGAAGAPTNCRKRCGYGLPNPESYFCPAGSSIKTAVRVGYYAAGIGDPANEEETRDQEKECKPPYYCPGGGTLGNGEEIFCPAGRFGATNRLTDASCSGACAPGFFCTTGSDQNDENRCGREQGKNAAAFYCPPGSATRTAVSPNMYTFCCAVKNPSCPSDAAGQSQIIACPEDQRHYQGPCPAGFTCQNGKQVTIKWRDEGNIGQCFANDITKPNVGVSKGDVEEGSTGALFHESGQVERTSGITGTTSTTNRFMIDTSGYASEKIVYYTKTSGTTCSSLVSETFYKISAKGSGWVTLKPLTGGSVISIATTQVKFQ